MPDGAASFDGGLHAHAAEAEASSSYAHRLAQLAAERSREEQRHLEEIARLRTQVRGGAGAGADGAPVPPAAAMAAWQHEGPASLQLGATSLDAAAAASCHAAAASLPGGGGGAAGGAAAAAAAARRVEGGEGARQQARERQQRRLAELERHVSVLQAGGVASELGRKRLARLQAELRRLEAGEVGGGATAPLAHEQPWEQRGFERGFEVVDESEML